MGGANSLGCNGRRGCEKGLPRKARDVSTHSSTMIMEGFASTERGVCWLSRSGTRPPGALRLCGREKHNKNLIPAGPWRCMFWRSVLESYGWGLDLPDSRADVHACCTVYKFSTRRFSQILKVASGPGPAGCGR